MTHKLKIWPGYYSEVSSGSKTYEARKNDLSRRSLKHKLSGGKLARETLAKLKEVK